MIKPEKASGTLGLALPDEGGGWCILRDEQREHLAAETLVESEVAANRDDLVIGMGSHNEYTLFLDCSQLGRHPVRETVNPSK
jgi:hypothetical protein